MTASLEAPPTEAREPAGPPPRPLAQMLDETVRELNRYVHFAVPEQADAVALWIAHTHIIERLETSPRLAIRAPSKQSGKTRLLEVLKQLVKDGWHIVGPSGPVLFRKIEKEHPTILLDEADRLFEKRAEDMADIVQVLNAGHTQGSSVPRVVGPKHELHDFPAFAAVALAGIGTDWPDTVIDRSIVINMERKIDGEDVERLRKPGRQSLHGLGRVLGASVAATVTTIYVPQDALPAALSDRSQDGWEPLIAIADTAGEDWPRRARTAAVALAEAGNVGSEQRPEVLLLRDMRAIFESEGDPAFLPTATLHFRLLAIAESPWKDEPRPLTQNMIGRHMRIFGISSCQPHRGGPRGYNLADIQRQWGRLGTPGSLLHLITTTPDATDQEDAA